MRGQKYLDKNWFWLQSHYKWFKKRSIHGIEERHHAEKKIRINAKTDLETTIKGNPDQGWITKDSNPNFKISSLMEDIMKKQNVSQNA